MKKTLDLCLPCAQKMKQGYSVSMLPRARDKKVTCGLCSRRRYGATYTVEKRKPV